MFGRQELHLNDPPRVLLTPEQLRELTFSNSAFLDFAERIAGMLRMYPHFVVVKGSSADDEGAFTRRLCESLAGTGTGQLTEPPKVDFSRVEIRPEKPNKAAKPDKKHRGKRYSFTNQQMDLHTDSTFDARPHELVAMQLVRVDPDGGDSLIAPVENVLAELDDEVKQILAEPNFPFGPGLFPILWQEHDAPNIRYYRSQIDSARENGGHMSERSLEALNSLDAVLRRADTVFHFHAEAGETVYMHNTKVLHGRTSFSEHSDRLMYRLRIYAPNLG
jgi:alpha-ketoglutarate-dependent taurine dioxygenase